MLKLFDTIQNQPVLSLRTGGSVGILLGPIINPNNLYIEGWYVQDSRSSAVLILLSGDIREVIDRGFIIDDHEVLTDEKELVRLKEIIDLKFQPLKLRVYSVSGKRYGKVSDFAIETSSFYIQKIYASQSIVRNISGGTLSIDRSQIVEISNHSITIEDPTEKVSATAPAAA